MYKIDLNADYKRFEEMWEYRENRKMNHSSSAWDNRAEDWGKELEKNGGFQKSLSDRVSRVSEYLRNHGLLTQDSRVIDIGCGPGRFVAEFARTSKHVTGMDISPEMLKLGAEYAKKEGLSNVSFVAGDFREFDISDAGWENQFDLVFTSITPAIGTLNSLEKLMKICRGYCFNSCFVRWEDNIERRISEEVLGIPYRPSHGKHDIWFYSLFNLLWLKGYFPETSYHRQNCSEYADADADLARYYSRTFSENLQEDDEMTEKILDFLKKNSDSGGKIIREYQRWYGWILWDTRIRSKRLPE